MYGRVCELRPEDCVEMIRGQSQLMVVKIKVLKLTLLLIASVSVLKDAV